MHWLNCCPRGLLWFGNAITWYLPFIAWVLSSSINMSLEWLYISASFFPILVFLLCLEVFAWSISDVCRKNEKICNLPSHNLSVEMPPMWLVDLSHIIILFLSELLLVDVKEEVWHWRVSWWQRLGLWCSCYEPCCLVSNVSSEQSGTLKV